MNDGDGKALKTGAELDAKSELRDYLHGREDRHRVFPKAALVGIVAGLVAVAFRAILAVNDHARDQVRDWAHRHGSLGVAAAISYSAIGALFAILIVRKVAAESAGSGIPHLESVLRRHRGFRWKRVLPAKFLGGAMAIGAGLPLGREGPTVQMGGAVGAGLARLWKTGSQERLVLVAAGAGAGLAAAFNAPLAGLIFVLEELQRDFRPMVFGAAFIAAASADVVSRLFSGQLPAFTAPAYPTPILSLLPAFAILGMVAGLLGVLFNRSLLKTLYLFEALGPKRRVLAGLATGICVGIVGYVGPQFIGGGHDVAEAALGAKLAMGTLPLIFLARFLLGTAAYGSGAPGGIFAPLLALGSVTGLYFGDITSRLYPQAGVMPGAFAVVGMAAYFTAIVRAPLTGIVLIVEMTSSYALSLPLLVACFCAYGVAEAMKDMPIYEALLQRDLARGGGEVPSLDEPLVLELEIEPGSKFAGRKVKELGLPSGVLLVSCRDGHREWVPDAATKLEPHMRVTAVISQDSEDGLAAFREGCI